MLVQTYQVKTLRDLWIELWEEEKITVGYQAFAKWAKSLDIEPRRGILPVDEERLRGLAAVKQAGVRRPCRRGYEKEKVRRMMMQMGREIDGRTVIHIAEIHRVCDRTTLYKRAKRAGLEFSSAQMYPTIQMIKLVLGASIS